MSTSSGKSSQTQIELVQVHVLNTVLDSLPSGLILFSPEDDAILSINQRAKEILGLPLEGTFTLLSQLPDYLVELRMLLKQSQGDILRSELNLILPCRTESSTLGFTLKEIDVDAKNSGHSDTHVKAFVFSDITTLLRDRLAMDKIKDELYQSKKLASIGTMISGVAHELNNPLTGISMSSQLTSMTLERMKKQLKDNQTPDESPVFKSVQQALNEVSKISHGAQRASALVSDLLTYSKPVKLNITLENLNLLLDEMIQAVKTHPEFQGVTFELTKHEPPFLVLCDRIKIEQVLYNLFKNASDATERRATLRIWFDTVTNVEKQQFAVIHVADNGPGIDKTILGRIFDPFFTTKGNAGVGLGLSISYRTIEQHGGQLAVESEKGQGTEFTIALPLLEEEDAIL